MSREGTKNLVVAEVSDEVRIITERNAYLLRDGEDGLVPGRIENIRKKSTQPIAEAVLKAQERSVGHLIEGGHRGVRPASQRIEIPGLESVDCRVGPRRNITVLGEDSCIVGQGGWQRK